MQIEDLDKKLKSEQKKVLEYQHYFAKSSINFYNFSLIALLVVSVFLGFKAGRQQWDTKMGHQVVELGRFTFLASLKKMLLSFLI